MEGTIPALTLRALVQGLGALGIETDGVLRSARLDPSRLETPHALVEDPAYPNLWRAAFAVAGRDELAVEAGRAVPWGALGALDYLAASAPTVGAAVEAVREAFAAAATDAELAIEPEAGGDVRIRLVNHLAFEEQPWSDEFALASLVGRLRGCAKAPLELREVELTRRSLAPAALRSALGAPVAVRRPTASLLVRGRSWWASTRAPDPALHATLRHLLEAQSPPRDRRVRPLPERVRALLRASLASGGIDQAAAARRLGLSVRSLQRRLRDEGTAFEVLLDEERRAVALALLEEPGLSISQIADRVGYAEPAAFARAFRRWTGVSPRAFRRAHRATVLG